MKYPNIHVRLVGENGDASAILGRVQQAMRDAQLPETEIAAFIAEAKSGDYNNLLQTCMQWVDCS
jgi:hypothetical protein